ncbi:hypothetical protein C900_00271 [Fulvivirga imtechensis AK7]|uniref:DUF6922 domain-containing protein n=1 Tax=Fulvivirga imtechensis AK7 TaxID=1237149 RepID=L8JI78_9BACT|nr:hypothetical protein [Fulvivirga imtechensis]ELR68530.1 hypothetical protein C900_00271 [Fulvivirga imtechensis AK7]
MNWQKKLFWDIDVTTLDTEKHAGFIMERVLHRGDLDDWNQLKKMYGWARLKEEAIKLRNLDLKTLIFLSTILNIPKDQFRCYSQIQLNQNI